MQDDQNFACVDASLRQRRPMLGASGLGAVGGFDLHLTPEQRAVALQVIPPRGIYEPSTWSQN